MGTDCTCLSFYQQDPTCPWHHPTQDDVLAERERARVDEVEDAFTVVAVGTYDAETDDLDLWPTEEALAEAREKFRDLP